MDPNAYSYEDTETDSVSKLIILILEPITMPEPILIPELIPQTDSGPAIRNRFQKTSELTGNDSGEILIFFITIRNPRLYSESTFIYKMLSVFFNEIDVEYNLIRIDSRSKGRALTSKRTRWL